MSYLDFGDLLAGTRVMVILRGLGADRTLDLATRAWDAGVLLVEVPIQRPADLEALTLLAEAGRRRGLVVGAGTVLDPAHVRLAVSAGAGFTVSPGIDEDVVRASLDAGLPTLPGVATASDVQRALRMGLRWLKAFPAAQLGPGWLTALRGPFPDVRFVATGGVDILSAPAYLAAGAAAVSLGSAIEEPGQLERVSELVGPA